MESFEIKKQIREFLLEEFPAQEAELTYEADLLDNWFVDSVRIVEIILFLESRFGVFLNRADIQGSNFQNIDSIAELVQKHMSQE